MITIDNKFEIGETVYLVTDKDQLPNVVFSIEVTQGNLLYKIAHGTTTSEHYDFELSREVNVILQTS